MKRTVHISLLMLSIFLLAVAVADGQQIKKKKEVKIIMSSDGNKTVVIDTTFTGKEIPDSIILKDGKTVYINSDDELSDTEGNGKNRKFTISVTGSGDKDKELSEGITVVANTSDDDVKESATEKKYTYVITDKKGNGNSDSRFDYFIDSRIDGSSENKSNYVIAKDGVVITIEGSNEDKVKEITSFIEDKMGVKKDKKTVKK